MLWAGSGEQQARNSLRQALVDIRRLFPSTGDEAIRLEGNADTIWLAANADEADIWIFDQKIQADDGESLATAADFYRGDLLDGVSLPHEIDEWLAPFRANYTRKALDLAERLSLLPELGSRQEQAC
ncbi:MAG: adenylate cyclase, partial [Mesorhizobium sp.]